MNRAGTALADAAAVFGADEAQRIAKDPESGVSGVTSTERDWPFTRRVYLLISA